jgi:subtilisin-like proprotein convertase family protein
MAFAPAAAEAQLATATPEPVTKGTKPVPSAAVRPLMAPTPVPGAEHGRPWDDIANWNALPPRARLTTLLAQPFGLQDRGQVRLWELARDELHLRSLPNPRQRVFSIPLQADAEGLLREAEAIATRTGEMPQLVFYPPGAQVRSPSNRRILSDQVLMQSPDVTAAVGTATRAGLQNVEAMTAAPGYLLARDNRFPGAALVASADLAAAPGITESRPLLGMQMSKRLAPNDPLFAKQWHLKQTNGIHVNASAVWDTNQGSAITVGIVDDGLQLTHPDLSANIDTSNLHRDYVGGDNDPAPFAPVDDPGTEENEAEEGDSHGTSVGGLVAARGNNAAGGSGVAPEAKLVGIRLLSDSQTAADEAAAFGHRNDVIQIKNNSWGPEDIAWVLGTIDPVVKTALATAAGTGRGGLGTIITFAAGNGRDSDDQSNKDAYANSIHTFAIGALTKTGTPAVYSEYGANLIACAPADGVTTTDLTGDAGYNPTQDFTALTDRAYTDEFNGTSAACPVSSGVIALMLQANPNLGWRDVKEILLRTGKKVGAADAEWVTRSGGRNGIAPIKHNPKYGGGMVDAAAATAMAASWTNLGTQSAHTLVINENTAIPDNNATGIKKTFDFTGETPMRVEMVEVTVDISHEYRGDLTIQLISPSGTVSNLTTRSADDGGEEDPELTNPIAPSLRGFHGWTFTSARHWGESSKGQWKLAIADRSAVDTGMFHNATVKLHGVSAPPVQITSPPAGLWATVGSSASFSVTSTGFADISQQWRKGTANITGAIATSYSIPVVSTTHAANYSVLVSNVTGSELSAAVPLGVYTPSPAAITVNVDKVLTLTATATAPPGTVISYLWRRNGVGMTDDPPPTSTARILGTHTKTLTVKNVTFADEDTYDCLLKIGTLEQSAGNTVVTVRLKPDIQTTAFPTDLIVSSAAVNIPLTIGNGFTSVVITGLPSGLTYNKTTGVISGIPDVSVTNLPIKITATNLAGSTTSTVNLTIAALDADVVGTFNGLVSRNANTQANSNYGGYLSNLKVMANGTITGTLRMAGLSHAFSGRLAATTSGNPTASITVKRKGLPDVLMSLTIDRDNGKLTGPVEQLAATAWTASVEAWRNPYSATNKATLAGLATVHNFWMEPPSGTTTAKPQGTGYGSAVVSTLGAVTLACKVADGSSFTQTTTIGTLNHIALHAMLYNGKGSVGGWLLITDQAPPAYNTLSGALQWNKTGPASLTDRLFASGFDFGVLNASLLTLRGSEWRKPATTPPPAVILWGITDVAAGQVNAALTFAGGDIEGSASWANANKQLRILTTHLVNLPLPNDAAVSLTLTPTTGQFSGSVTLKDGTPAVLRKFSYFGVISLHHQQGRGFFTLPGIPVATTPILSGSVELNEVP